MKKGPKLFLLTGLVAILIIGLSTATLINQIKSDFRNCLSPQDSSNLNLCLSKLNNLESRFRPLTKIANSSKISKFLIVYDYTKSFQSFSSYFLGFDKPINILIFLQNDYEMRANGGFFGSYVVATLDHGEPDFRFQDIYVPDGQLSGHVEPPAPIQTAFKQGWFKLRDSDWEPDFTTASKTIRWFLDKGGEISPDIIMTINFSTIKEIVSIMGKFHVPEYQMDIDANNLYSLLQNQAEIGFFPGSTQKKDVLTAAGKAAISKLMTLDKEKYLDIAFLLIDQVNHQNILFSSTNEALQKEFESQDMAGQITIPKCKNENCINDSYLLVETNLGANKANCCTDRTTKHTISTTPNGFLHQVEINFVNHSPLENPSPPRFFGGNYISYLRFYLPKEATQIHIKATPTMPKQVIPPPPLLNFPGDNIATGSAYGLHWLGFFHVTAAGTESQISLSYLLQKNETDNYQLNILKQHGFVKSPQSIINGTKFETDLENDISYP